MGAGTRICKVPEQEQDVRSPSQSDPLSSAINFWAVRKTLPFLMDLQHGGKAWNHKTLDLKVLERVTDTYPAVMVKFFERCQKRKQRIKAKQLLPNFKQVVTKCDYSGFPANSDRGEGKCLHAFNKICINICGVISGHVRRYIERLQINTTGFDLELLVI